MIHPKVIAGTSAATIGGAVVTLVLYLLGLRGIVVPEAVASALTVLATALCAFLGGYMTPNPPVAAPGPQKGP